MSGVVAPDPRKLKAWETRRARYGAAGHAGPYRTGGALHVSDNYRKLVLDAVADDLGSRALALVLRLYAEGALSEGQCAKALQIDRVSFRALVDDGARRQL